MKIEDDIRNYIQTELLDSNESIDLQDNLLIDGLVDSIGALQIAGFIGETFGVEVTPDDFVVENFETVAALAKLVRLKRGDSAESNDGDG